MMKNYKNCQSCGMPMSKDPEKGGQILMEQKAQRIAVIAIRKEHLPNLISLPLI